MVTCILVICGFYIGKFILFHVFPVVFDWLPCILVADAVEKGKAPFDWKKDHFKRQSKLFNIYSFPFNYMEDDCRCYYTALNMKPGWYLVKYAKFMLRFMLEFMFAAPAHTAYLLFMSAIIMSPFSANKDMVIPVIIILATLRATYSCRLLFMRDEVILKSGDELRG